MSLSSQSGPRNAATLPNCIFSEALLDGSLKVLRVVVLASKNNDIFQSATNEQLPFHEESEIPCAKV